MEWDVDSAFWAHECSKGDLSLGFIRVSRDLGKLFGLYHMLACFLMATPCDINMYTFRQSELEIWINLTDPIRSEGLLGIGS